jgi:glycosyltransferase involved in cell wall biosynthesis
LTTSSSLNTPLRIALVHTADQGGGAETSTYYLKKALETLGHHVRLIVGSKYGSDENTFQLQRSRPFPGALRIVKWVEDATGWQYIYQPWFARLDQLLGPNTDVVHYHSLWGGREGFADVAALPRLTRLFPSLMTLRDWWMLTGHCAHPAHDCERWKIGCGNCPALSIAPPISRDGTRFNWKRKQTAIRKSQLRVTTVSDWLGGLAKESPIFDGKAIHTVHNGIDTAAFFPRDKKLVRNKLGIPQDLFVVMIAGQAVEGTNRTGAGAPELALQALKQSNTRPFLLAVGESSSKVMAKWGEQGRGAPFQSDPAQLADYYSAADIVLVTSLWETFGRVAAEAQMCGTPVVAFATGGIPEIVKHEQTGLLAPTGNTQQLAQHLSHLNRYPELRDQYGQRAAQFAKSMFCHLEIAKRYVEHYRSEIALRRPESGR